MRRAWVLLLLLAFVGCYRATGGPAPGATSSEGAIQQFLFAAKSQDLQAMSAVFGNAESPLRDRADRQELEQRMLIMICHLRHDESRIGAAQAGAAGRVLHRVEITQGEKKATPTFTTVKNTKSGRWFVEAFEIQAMTGFCSGGMAPPQQKPLGAAGNR